MGGHKAGEIASKMALEALTSHLRKNPEVLNDSPVEALKQAFSCANKTVYNYAQTDIDMFRGMGTTITAAVHQANKIYIAYVGDSRAYLVRGNDIKLLTSDHSLVNELLKSGGLTEKEAKNHPQRNVLTRAIGTSVQVEVDVTERPVHNGDILILCTDGLSNLVKIEEIKQMAEVNESLAERAKNLVECALDRGGRDNVTVVLYHIE
jgi:serine/threonine protein phosphatase PrpC